MATAVSPAMFSGTEPACCYNFVPPTASDSHLRERVRVMLGRMYPQGLTQEHRRDARFPFPVLVRLTPVDPKTLMAQGPAITVVGKNLSEQGFGFFHHAPLPYRRAIVELEDIRGDRLSLLVDLSWCRCTRFGWYDNGGRFLQVVES